MKGGRHGARRLLLQALYQTQVGGHALDELIEQFSASPEYEYVDQEFFLSLLKEILGDGALLDSHIVRAADRPVTQLDPVERAILWIGLAELQWHPDVPASVAINEAVELAKEYGAETSYRYVNAILDSVTGYLRGSS
jgi:N utilization substance protein B